MKIICLIVVLLFVECAFSQNDSILEKFNSDKFEELKQNNLKSYFLKDSTKVTFTEFNDVYWVQQFNYNSYYYLKNVYYKNTQLLKSKETFFHTCPVGVNYKYDESGKLVNKKNYDSIYVFSIDDVRLLIKKKYNFDIFDVKQQTGFSRYKDGPPAYLVSINRRKKNSQLELLIDGVTGKIIRKERVKTEPSYNSKGEVVSTDWYTPKKRVRK